MFPKKCNVRREVLSFTRNNCPQSHFVAWLSFCIKELFSNLVTHDIRDDMVIC